MRILLISPGSPASFAYQAPLGLAYILSYLKQNGFADTAFFDRYNSGEGDLRKAVRRLRPALVGIQCQTPMRH